MIRGRFAKSAVSRKFVLGTGEASKFLGISRRHLYRLKKDRKLHFEKCGNRYFFRVIDLHKFMVRTGRDKPLPLSSSGVREFDLGV